MERKIYDINILNEFVKKFCKVIEKYTDYIIVSGFVAIASGRARGTEDIDMIIPKLDLDVFSKLHDDLVKNGFTCMQSSNPKDILEYLSDNTSVRYTYKDKPLPEMEIKFVKDELDLMQFKTKQKLPLTGLDVWFSSVNYTVAFKEEYLKSEKDIEDAKFLRIIYSELVDEYEITHIKRLIKKYRL